MRKSVGLLVFGLIVIPRCGWAQGWQNTDLYYAFGARSVNSQTIAGTGVTISGETTRTFSWIFGYQVKRFSAASLWLELPNATDTGSLRKTGAATVPGPVDHTWTAYVPGVRFMVPLKPRFSIFGVTGVGVGDSHYPVVDAGPPPSVVSNKTFHGVFEFGAGVDIRVSRWLSVRADIRDYVTGRGLGGVPGPQHLVPQLGFAFHF